MNTSVRVASLLIDLEAELRQLGLWQTEAPSAEALASQEPFCIDTLSFPQWLQFVFIERLTSMIAEESPLPTGSRIVPMAEEYFRSRELPVLALLRVLQALDRALSD